MIPNLDVDLLKTFLAIADTGNFTRAAEEVNKTQSAVSMQMKRLEELVGRPLFVRDRGRRPPHRICPPHRQAQ
jgi:DNA-binding transcriptional LysR family regulator